MTKLHIAEGLSLPLEAVTQTFGILAVRGAGKSNTGAVMAEEMARTRLPFVVVDPVGSWWGLRSSDDGKGPGLSIPIFGGRHADVPLERAAGQLLADLVVDQRLSCLLDVSEFSEGDKIRFLTDFAERLYRRNQDPLHLFLEEADDYAPQRPFREQARCLRAWENIVRRGRARGLGITMISQRSAAINKNVLTQIETLIVLRTTSPQDRKAIEAWVEYHGQSRELLESLPGLKDGEAWVWSPHWLHALKRVQVRRRTTFDSGATPKEIHGKRPPATLADVDLQSIQQRMAATIERAKAEDPRELRRQLAEVRAELAKAKQAQPPPAEPTIIEMPVLQDNELARAEKILARLDAIRTRTGEELLSLKVSVDTIAEAIAKAARSGQAHLRAGRPLMTHNISTKSQPSPKSRANTRPAASDVNLGKGEFCVLTAVAQYAEGATREQLTVLTGYRRSSRDTYLQRLRQAGLVGDRGGVLLATEAGVARLGPDFEPLPTGAALREYWLARLPEGERRILVVLLAAHPKSVDRESLGEATEYKRSSRDTYLQRLLARRLVEAVGRGEVKAADVLFERGE